jgi:adenylosuccinate lyase
MSSHFSKACGLGDRLRVESDSRFRLLDTTLAVQLMESAGIILDDLQQLRDAIATQARRFKMTPMIGRSHGIHAEPITFGLKLALMFDEFGRAEERLAQTLERVRVGKLSGAVGTHAHLDPAIEKKVCEKLGLKAEKISTQIVQRDRHAEFVATLALIASSIDRWATEFRHLQRTEVLEVEEFFGEEQKGSSSMPHKRNPITGERLSGLARVIRGNAVAAFENVALWHERDISHSSAERIILPDSCILVDYMLVKLRGLVKDLQVYPERMQKNLEITKVTLQSVYLARDTRAWNGKALMRRCSAAMKTWKKRGDIYGKRQKGTGSWRFQRHIDGLCSWMSTSNMSMRHFERWGLVGRGQPPAEFDTTV